MTDIPYGYTEHTKFEQDGLSVIDATSTGPRPHDDLIWIGLEGQGRWFKPLEAMAYCRAIQSVVAAHCERRAIAATIAAQPTKHDG